MLISLDPLSFKIIEEYLAHIKELQLKLGECGKDFPKKDGQFIELILMNLKTLYYVLCLTFCASWTSKRKMVRIIHLTFSMVYWLGHMKNFSMKGNLRSSNKQIWWKDIFDKITKKRGWHEKEHINLIDKEKHDVQILKRKAIKRRKNVAIAENWDTWRRFGSKRPRTYERKWKAFKEIWWLEGWPIFKAKIQKVRHISMHSLLVLLRSCILTP